MNCQGALFMATAGWGWAALIAAGLAVGIGLGEATYRFLARWQPFRRVRISLRLLAPVAVAAVTAEVVGPVIGVPGRPEHIVTRVLWAATVLFSVVVAARLLEGFVVVGALGVRAEAAFPTLVRQILFLGLIVVAALLVLDVYFHTPPSALLASSVVLSAVVGLSLQQTLGSVAAGVALQSEQVFRLGDWISIGDLEGEVVRMTWRTIHLRTRAHDVVIIPNDHAARGVVVNYALPSRVHATIVEVGTHYRHSPDVVRRVLREATLAARGVLQHPEPRIRLVEYGDFAIKYRIKFFLDDYEALHDIQAAVMSNIWYHFRRHGIQIPFPIRTVTMTPVTASTLARDEAERVARVRAALRAADLLKPLSDEAVDRLARRVQTPAFGAGESLFAQDDPGDSCYLLVSGRVAVRFRDEKGLEIGLAELAPGAILGEMSLLTGAPRSAAALALEETETIRIGHADLAEVLAANPQLAEALAAILEERQTATAHAREAAHAARRTGAAQEERRRMVQRILHFFGLSRPTPGPP